MYIYLYVYSPWTGLQSITGQTHSNSEPSRCEATLLTTTPLCHPPTFVSAVSPTLRMYNCVLEVTAMSVISIVAWLPSLNPLFSPPISVSVCSHGCWAALRRAVCFLGPTWDDKPGLRRAGRGGRMRPLSVLVVGVTACPPITQHLLSSLSLFFPSSLLLHPSSGSAKPVPSE